MKKYLLFDLDGTLTNSMEGITNSVAYALKAFGIQEDDRQKLCKFIGPPLVESFRKYYGFDETQALEAVVKYREYFTAGGMFENEVYKGIPELLQHQKALGKTLIVATAKPTIYTKQILEYFGLEEYFDDVQGSNLDGTRVEKEEVIRYVLEVNQITDCSQAVMIGDRQNDICGGKSCHMETIGVLYGFGSREELESCGADHIAATVEELDRILTE